MTTVPPAPLTGRNVFVLCTGRCGSTTFIKASAHMRNYTAGHETRTHLIGPARLDYAPGHIEADNRLSWFLGRLDQVWGDRALYVHLTRDRDAVAQSFLSRWGNGVIAAYHSSLLMNAPKLSPDTPPLAVCGDYVDTVTANIRHFLRDKTHVLSMTLENGKADFARFWDLIGATGNRDAALAEWDVKHNATRPAKRAQA